MVDSPIRSYRETIGLVNEASTEYNEAINTGNLEEKMLENKDPAKQVALTGVSATIGSTVASQVSSTIGTFIVGTTKHDIFTLDEGQVVIHWPANMSEESFEDFKEWLKLLEKKIGRAYNKKSGDGSV